MQKGRSLHAEDKSIQSVFFGEQRFRVPRYQRPYSWEIGQVAEFWEDLIASDEPDFLGSFILSDEHEKKEGFLDIIDGQQRLLTITLLSAVLRDVAQALDEDVSDLYQRKDISIEDRKGKLHYRILPAETLAEYFEEHVQEEGGDIGGSAPDSAEEKRVKDNYLYLRDKVGAEVDRHSTKESKLARIEDLRTRLSNQIVIRVDVSNEDDAYEIFETTNARGLELSVADLLKNLVFRKIPPANGSDIAKDIWLEMTSNIEATGTELKRFVRYFWMSKYQFMTEKKLFRAIKSEITDWNGLLDDLADNSRWYKRLLDGSEDEFTDMKNGVKMFQSVFAIRLMGISQCLVFLLAIFRNFDKLQTDPTGIIQTIEKFSFKYSVICKQPANRVEKLYSQHAIKLEKAVQETNAKKRSGEVQKVFSSLAKDLHSILPGEELFKESFQRVGYRNTVEGRALVKYILGRLDSHYSGTNEYKIDFNTVNIEHLLPVTPHKDWKLDKKQIKPYVNLLANLTLLSKKINSKIQNAILSEKLPELIKSELAITKELLKDVASGGSVWSEKEIKERQNKLAALSFKVWE